MPDVTCGRSVDGHVGFYPSTVAFPETTFAWEFVYVVDLDRETFTCHRRWPQRWLWPLNAIPRAEAYFAALRHGENLERLMWGAGQDLTTAGLADTTGLQGAAGAATADAGDEATGHGESRTALYDDPVPFSQLVGGSAGLPDGWHTLAAAVERDLASPLAASQSMRGFLFQQLVSRFRHVLRENVIPASVCANAAAATDRNFTASFMYREFVFAVVSIAAGEFALVDAQSLRLYARHDVSLSTTTAAAEDGSEKVAKTWLPFFRSGAHLRGVAPGSAPAASMYLFENVLVSVVASDMLLRPSGTDLVATINAARAFARRTRPRLSSSEFFYGIVFALTVIVSYRARIDGSHNDGVNVNNNTDDDDNDNDDDNATTAGAAAAAVAATVESPVVEVSDYLPLLSVPFLISSYVTRLPWDHGSFAALMHHFDAALPPVRTLNCGALPDELLERVLDATAAAGEWRTSMAMAAATPALKRYARRRVVLHDRPLRLLDEWVHPRRADRTLCDSLLFAVDDAGADDRPKQGKDAAAAAATDNNDLYLAPLPSHHFDWTPGRPDRRLLHLVIGSDPQRLCLVAEVGAMMDYRWHEALAYAAYYIWKDADGTRKGRFLIPDVRYSDATFDSTRES